MRLQMLMGTLKPTRKVAEVKKVVETKIVVAAIKKEELLMVH